VRAAAPAVLTESLVQERAAEVGAALAEARQRGGATWDALRGQRVVAVRRWPWALGAALAGAAAGVLVAVVVRRLTQHDAPGAQEPEQLQAVVDRGPTGTPG
jgi:hypothetical protein